jgi:hypothetical protein
MFFNEGSSLLQKLEENSNLYKQKLADSKKDLSLKVFVLSLSSEDSAYRKKNSSFYVSFNYLNSSQTTKSTATLSWDEEIELRVADPEKTSQIDCEIWEKSGNGPSKEYDTFVIQLEAILKDYDPKSIPVRSFPLTKRPKEVMQLKIEVVGVGLKSWIEKL